MEFENPETEVKPVKEERAIENPEEDLPRVPQPRTSGSAVRAITSGQVLSLRAWQRTRGLAAHFLYGGEEEYDIGG